VVFVYYSVNQLRGRRWALVPPA